ncbi:MAG TPA: hypothetical protein VGC60_00765 [Pyrinomonadaceae bacterium]
MHTEQILMMTKMLTNADLPFYEFNDSKAVANWKTQSAHSE